MSDTRHHIAHVFPSRSWGGAEIYSIEIASRQLQKGMNVSIWGSEGSRLIEEARKQGIPTFTEPISQRTEWSSLWRLRKFLIKNKITHLHLHWSGGVWVFFGITKLAGVRLIYHNHMWIKHYKIDPFHWLAYFLVDRLIVAGPRALSAARKHIAISASKISVVPYGIDLLRREKLFTTRADWNIPEDAYVMGVFARLDRQKGQEEFLRAVQNFASHQKLHVLLVGDPTLNETDSMKYSGEINELVEGHPLKERIHRYSSRKDYLEILNHCDVLVAPSYHESYSLIILDAFMLSKPVLSTNSGGSPDLVSHERGWLVPPKSSHALEEVIASILNNPEEAKSKGEAARSYVEAEHSFEGVLKKLNQIYFES